MRCAERGTVIIHNLSMIQRGRESIRVDRALGYYLIQMDIKLCIICRASLNLVVNDAVLP